MPTVALYADACFAFRLGAVVIGEEAQSRHRKRSLLQSIQDTYTVGGVETLTRTLPIDIFSCSPFATIFSPMFKYILCNTFNYVGVNLMHAIKCKCLFGFGSI